MEATIDTVNLAKSFINICNAAMVQYIDNPVYLGIENYLTQQLEGKTIALRIVSDDNTLLVSFETRFVNGQFTPLVMGSENADKSLQLKCKTMEEVVDNADKYLKHPEKLNFTWLRTG